METLEPRNETGDCIKSKQKNHDSGKVPYDVVIHIAIQLLPTIVFEWCCLYNQVEWRGIAFKLANKWKPQRQEQTFCL